MKKTMLALITGTVLLTSGVALAGNNVSVNAENTTAASSNSSNNASHSKQQSEKKVNFKQSELLLQRRKLLS